VFNFDYSDIPFKHSITPEECMKSSNFGQILASLRKELKDAFDEPMTQKSLAELAGIPLVTLQKIEQGRLEKLDTDLVIKLADALNVPSYARVNFYLSALKLFDASQKYLPSVNDVVDQAGDQIADIQYPAFIMTCFGDIIKSTPSFIKLFNLNLREIGESRLLSCNNYYRFLFSPDFSELHATLGESYSSFVSRRILLFKSETLGYRNNWYFLKLIHELNSFPKFRLHWQNSLFQYQNYVTISNPFSLNHTTFGKLSFLSTPISIYSDILPIIVVSYRPKDKQTALACVHIREEFGNELVQMSPVILPERTPDVR